LSEFSDRHEAAEAPPTLGREGLPAGYRMRADRHYVEQLEAPRTGPTFQFVPVSLIDPGQTTESEPPQQTLVDSIRRHGVITPLAVQSRTGRYRVLSGTSRLAAASAAGVREVPCVVYHVDDVAAARIAEAARVTEGVTRTTDTAADAVKEAPAQREPSVAGDLSASLDVVSQCLDIATADRSPALARTVALDLTRSELARAKWLVQATSILRKDAPITRRRTPIAPIADRAGKAWDAERRLRGAKLETEVDAKAAAVNVDADALVCAVSGLLAAVAHLGDQNAEQTITLTVKTDAAGGMGVTVARGDVTPPAEWASRAFDVAWEDRPGGVPAAVAFQIARHVAEAHQGTVAASTRDGASVTLALPRERTTGRP
jgi:ParB-like chromosome segregation protein Spo0J